MTLYEGMEKMQTWLDLRNLEKVSNIAMIILRPRRGAWPRENLKT